MRQCGMSAYTGCTCQSESAGIMQVRENWKHENRDRADRTAPVCVKGADMKKIFEKIIKKLQSEVERWEDSGKQYNDRCEIAVARGLRNAIEIVKQTATEYNNGWIPCSERLPEKYNRVLAYTDAGGYYIAHVNGCGKFVCTAECVSTVIENSDVIAWKPLPAPYQSKGE